MKAVRDEKKIPDNIENWKAAGRQLEAENNIADAILLYDKVVKKFPHEVYLYDRLLILHRKEKAYKRELTLINTAITIFSALLQPAAHKQSNKVTRLSKSILQSVGLADKKGQPVYLPQPLARWEKRKQIIMQKLTTKK